MTAQPSRCLSQVLSCCLGYNQTIAEDVMALYTDKNVRLILEGQAVTRLDVDTLQSSLK